MVEVWMVARMSNRDTSTPIEAAAEDSTVMTAGAPVDAPPPARSSPPGSRRPQTAPATSPRAFLAPNVETRPAATQAVTQTQPDARSPADAPSPESARELTVEERFDRAKRLEEQGKADEALKIVQEIAATTPLSRQPDGLDDAIRRLEAAAAKEKVPRFFKVED
jgi:hypothetical protein